LHVHAIFASFFSLDGMAETFRSLFPRCLRGNKD
jgi:hypothetical protein